MKSCIYTILRHADGSDYTLNGLSSKVTMSLLFWDCENSEAIAYCEQHNIDPNLQFILVDRTLWGEDHSYAEPLVKPEDCAQVNGGNFLYTSNGLGFKFKGENIGRPIPVHDRFETWEMYEQMSM